MTGLQATLRNIETGRDDKIPPLSGYRAERAVVPEGPTQMSLREAREQLSSSLRQEMTGTSTDAPPPDQKELAEKVSCGAICSSFANGN